MYIMAVFSPNDFYNYNFSVMNTYYFVTKNIL